MSEHTYSLAELARLVGCTPMALRKRMVNGKLNAAMDSRGVWKVTLTQQQVDELRASLKPHHSRSAPQASSDLETRLDRIEITLTELKEELRRALANESQLISIVSALMREKSHE